MGAQEHGRLRRNQITSNWGNKTRFQGLLEMEDENRPWELTCVEVLLGYSYRGWHLRELEGQSPTRMA